MRGQLEGEIQTVPGEIQQAEAANEPKPSWADNTKVGFIDLDDRMEPDADCGFEDERDADGQGQRLWRRYQARLSVHRPHIQPDLLGEPDHRFRTERDHPERRQSATHRQRPARARRRSSTPTSRASSTTWRSSSSFRRRKTPWIPFVEEIYGYRFVDKVIVDNNKFGNSSDWGVEFPRSRSWQRPVRLFGARLRTALAYKNPIRSKTMDVEARANVNWHGFVLGSAATTATSPTTSRCRPPRRRRRRSSPKPPAAGMRCLPTPTRGSGPASSISKPTTGRSRRRPRRRRRKARSLGCSIYGSVNINAAVAGVRARDDDLDPEPGSSIPTERYRPGQSRHQR